MLILVNHAFKKNYYRFCKSCESSLCQIFQDLASNIYLMLWENKKIITHQTSEETITDLIVRELKIWKKLNNNLNFSIKSFTKKEEGKNGADFEWDLFFVDRSGSKWLGCRIQAKILNLKENKFLSLDYKSNKKTNQIDLLRKSSLSDGKIPFYCFYLYKPGVDRRCGCSLASLEKVSDLLKQNKKPSVDEIIKISFPWHKLICNSKNNEISLPDMVLSNLKEISRLEYIDFLNEDKVEKMRKFLDSEIDIYDSENYPFEILPDRVTIVQEKGEKR